MYYQKFWTIFYFTILLNTLGLPKSTQQATETEQNEPPAAPLLSMLALKSQGACTNPNLVTEYKEACSKSSLTIYSGKEHFENRSQVPVRINSIMKVKQQKDLLMTELISRALYDSKVPRHQPHYALDLLSTVIAIYSQACPFVPASFLQTIYHSFTYLHWLTAHNRKEYLKKREQKWISTIIQNCTSTLAVPVIIRDRCSETFLNMRNCSTFICTDSEYEFKLTRTDPIVDVVFKAMELVQSVCFPKFKQSYRMFHFFHLTIMDLFTEEIKTRWATQLENANYWSRLLGPRFEHHLMNLERCSEGIIATQKFHYRIPRSSLPARIRLDGVLQ